MASDNQRLPPGSLDALVLTAVLAALAFWRFASGRAAHPTTNASPLSSPSNRESERRRRSSETSLRSM